MAKSPILPEWFLYNFQKTNGINLIESEFNIHSKQYDSSYLNIQQNSALEDPDTVLFKISKNKLFVNYKTKKPLN